MSGTDRSLVACRVVAAVAPHPLDQLLGERPVDMRTTEKNRVEKLLEDAQIKLSVVASEIFGVSGRAMMAALIAGERDRRCCAEHMGDQSQPEQLTRGRAAPRAH